MKDLLSTAEQTLTRAQKSGNNRSQVEVSFTQAQEFNIEAGRLTLLRTTFDQNLSLQALQDDRQALVSGNQFSDAAISDLVSQASAMAKASPADSCNGFAPNQGQKIFQFGDKAVEEEWMFKGLTTMLDQCRERYPKVILDSGVLRYVSTKQVLLSSEGSCLQAQQAYYEGMVMLTAKEGKNASSFNYTTMQLPAASGGSNLDLLKIGNLEELVRQNAEQIHVQKIPAKFDGEIIVTPHCLSELLAGWAGFLSGGRMLKKSSFFSGKLGKKLASDQWTLAAKPLDSQFASRKFWTQDGYLSSNEMIFEKGVLKNYLLGHFVAQKLQEKISRSEGSYLQLSQGNKKLQDMIRSVKKGVLMCRFSGGNPAENGDVSGVAKNSYYIENGEIRFPLGETMVAINLANLLHEIQDVSQETVSSGTWELPWVRFAGASVS